VKNHKLTIAYDGAAYAGWQVQPGELTIQDLIEKALATITREEVRLHSSGRTDRGVHARAQVAHFSCEKSMPPQRMRRALNALLPDDIRIMKVARAAPDFHARFSARSKEYRYFIWNAEVMPPCLRNYRLHCRRKLDVVAMREAADALVGRHDFASFTANPNRVVESTVRNVTAVKVLKKGNEITIRACAEGFLYKMVRSLAGGLVRVGCGELTPDDIREILVSRERTARIPTAAPQGLFLWDVKY
jgi:tRNA pseudouridine38-40 synthase